MRGRVTLYSHLPALQFDGLDTRTESEAINFYCHDASHRVLRDWTESRHVQMKPLLQFVSDRGTISIAGLYRTARHSIFHIGIFSD